MISLFFSQKSQTRGLLAGIDPRTKILTFSALMTAIVLTPQSHFLKYGLYFALLVILIIWSQIPLSQILLRLLLVGTLIIFIAALVFLFQRRPFAENLFVLWNLFAKTVLVVICLSVLTLTTEFHRFIKGLELLRVPKIFISLLGFAYRYLQLLFDEALRVKRAIDSRSFKKRSKMQGVIVLQSALSHVFLRTFERSERIYAAMLSRGFEGRMTTMNFLSFKKGDIIFSFFFLAYLVFVLVMI